MGLGIKSRNYVTIFFSFSALAFPLFRHRRAIQKSRGSKVRRAEGTMESEPGAPASTGNTTGTTNSSSSTAAASSSNTSNTTTTTTATPTTSSSSSNSSSSGGSSNTSSTSSSTTTGRQAVPQISVYGGISDRQTVQVSSSVLRWNCS